MPELNCCHRVTWRDHCTFIHGVESPAGRLHVKAPVVRPGEKPPRVARPWSIRPGGATPSRPRTSHADPRELPARPLSVRRHIDPTPTTIGSVELYRKSQWLAGMMNEKVGRRNSCKSDGGTATAGPATAPMILPKVTAPSSTHHFDECRGRSQTLLRTAHFQDHPETVENLHQWSEKRK